MYWSRQTKRFLHIMVIRALRKSVQFYNEIWKVKT